MLDTVNIVCVLFEHCKNLSELSKCQFYRIFGQALALAQIRKVCWDCGWYMLRQYEKLNKICSERLISSVIWWNACVWCVLTLVHCIAINRCHDFSRFGPVNLFWSTRYDKAMTLFLVCLKEFAEFINSMDQQNGIPSEKCFKLPYK